MKHLSCKREGFSRSAIKRTIMWNERQRVKRKVSDMRSKMSSIPLEHLDEVIKRAKLQSCLLLIAGGDD